MSEQSRTININGFEVPEPVREPLKDGDEYYIVNLLCDDFYNIWRWHSDEFDMAGMGDGLIHKTPDECVIHAKALLSFTKKRR